MAGKMSAMEFACAAASLTLKPKALAAARRVLVDGEGQADVGKDAGSSRQTIYYWVSCIIDAHEKLTRAMAATAPAGWSVAIVSLPEDKMQTVAALVDAAQATLRTQGADHGKS